MDLLAVLQSLGIPPGILVYITGAVTLATALDSVLPHPTGPAWLVTARKIVGWVAISFGHGKTAGAVQAQATITANQGREAETAKASGT